MIGLRIPVLTYLLAIALTSAIARQGTAAESDSLRQVSNVLRSQADGMSTLDWSVIAVYAMGMLAIGWYYARRTENTDDYLLGGRKMAPLSVGLSLFATLLSTLSYLSAPGEMIRHGPIILLGTLAPLPLVI